MATTRTYAVGAGGRVIRLDNHLGPWVDITPNFPNENETTWFDVMTDPLDPDKVTIVGSANLNPNSIGSGILVSTDAGVSWTNPAGNWQTQPGETSREYREVWYVDSNVIWAIADGGTVVLSTDAGITFNTVNHPDKGGNLLTSSACIHALSDHIAIVGGSPDTIATTANAYVWKTIDGGVNWTRINGGAILPGPTGQPAGRPEGIWISSDETRIVVGCHYGQILSTDSGTSFNAANAPFIRSGYHLTWFPSHSPNPPTMRHTGGVTDTVNESPNNGTNWTITRPGQGFLMEGAHFWDTNDGYYTNTNTGDVDSTTDGAVTGVTSYNSPDGNPLYAVWTTLAIVDPPAGCPCYLATNCEDADETVAIQVDCTVDTPFNILNPNTIYQFSSPDYMVDKCWTIEEIDCPEQQTIDLGSGNDCDGNPGVYNDQDCQWNVTDIVSGTTPIGSPLPFPARVADQNWYGGSGNFTCTPGNNPPYGSQVGGQWITVGQLNNSGATPHTQNVASAAYELQFTPPINFIPNLHLEFLIDNSATFFLNGVQVNPGNVPCAPWNDPYIIDINLVDNNQAAFLPGVNTLRVETINAGGSGTNGINIIGTISNANPPSIEAVPISEWLDCDDCTAPPLVPNICWDLEVVCDGECDDIYAINGFDFTPYIGQNITIQPALTDPECWYTPYPLRQAVFIAIPPSSGGGYNLSWPFGAFQLGADDITISIPSFVYNGVEQIVTSPPTTLMTPANIQFVLCQQMACTNVGINSPGGITGYANAVDFINTTLASLGILTVQAFNNSFDNCPITQIKPRETIRIQYRDGDTFRFELQFSNIGQGVQTVVYEVQAGNVTVSVLNPGVGQTDLTTCNDNIYCLTDPATSPIINTATVMGDCPVEPIDLGESCEVVPRLGEPGFSTKNCDPKKVISIKCQFADSVFAHFKRVRYGIETCCEYDLDKIDIKNQLIDLGFIYDPDMCVNGTPIPEDCCLQPCDAEAEIRVPQFITCPAPTDASAILTTPIPETTCVEVTFSVGPGGNPDVPMTARFRDCCGDLTQIEVFPGAIPVTLCVDMSDPITTAPGVIVSEGPACACCPEPTALNGTTVPLRLKVEIGPV